VNLVQGIEQGRRLLCRSAQRGRVGAEVPRRPRPLARRHCQRRRLGLRRTALEWRGKQLGQGRDSPNSYQDFIRMLLPVSSARSFSAKQDITER
jgi:hypothetical protein